MLSAYCVTINPIWLEYYVDDADTCYIIKGLLTHKCTELSSSLVSGSHKGYKQHLSKGHMIIVGDMFILCQPLYMDTRYVGLIVVLDSICRYLFDHFHSVPSSSHMGTYKILFRMCMRFFRPRMREDIKTWVARCIHCVSYNVWRTRKSEI